MNSQTLRAVAYRPRPLSVPAYDVVVLRHDERRLRRRVLQLVHGDAVFVDFPEPVTLAGGGALELEDGRLVEVIAAEEELIEVRGRDHMHLMQLCWHLGNRHLKVQIEREWEGLGPRVLIQRDHVIRDMLERLGAELRDVSEPFHPLEGAYHAHGEHSHALLNR